MRAAVYVRVSSDEQARHGHSLEHQRLECRRLVAEMGAGEVLEFSDPGVSGAVLDRPGLDGLRAAVRSGEVDLVVVYDPDRLARRLAHQLILTEEIERRCRIAYVNFQWEATPEGQLFYQLRGAIAEYEREKIRERTMAGRRQKARGGRLPFAVEPYGYCYDSGRACLTIIPEEARVVRMIFRSYVEQEAGLAGIARNLEAMGVPTKRGGCWHRQTVRQMLGNSVYKGVYYANRRDMSGVGLNRYRSSGKTWGRERPRDEWIEVPVPAIVDEAQWNEAQRLLASGRPSGRSSDYLLTGVLYCRKCGLSMGGSRGSIWGQRVRQYTCRRRDGAGSRACGRRVDAEPLEDAVWRLICDRLSDPGEFRQVLSESANRAQDQEPQWAEAESIRRRRRALIALVERGVARESDVAESLGRLQRREEALLVSRADAGAGRGSDQSIAGDACRWLDTAGRLMPAGLKCRVVGLTVARVSVGKDTIDVRTLLEETADGIGHQQRDQDAPALDPPPET